MSGYDALVFLQNDNSKIIRNHFIEDNFQLYLEKIPVANYKIYAWLGEKFNTESFLFNRIPGCFETTASTNLIADSLKIKKNARDTFFLLLTSDKSMKNDSALLKSIFGIKN